MRHVVKMVERHAGDEPEQHPIYDPVVAQLALILKHVHGSAVGASTYVSRPFKSWNPTSLYPSPERTTPGAAKT